MSKYKLLKDLPYIKAGAVYIKDGGVYITKEVNNFTRKEMSQDTLNFWVVENNPEWFEEVEGNIKLSSYLADIYSKYTKSTYEYQEATAVKQAFDAIARYIDDKYIEKSKIEELILSAITMDGDRCLLDVITEIDELVRRGEPNF